MLATCALIVLGFGSRPEDYMGGHDHQEEHDHKEDGTWNGDGATEDMRGLCDLTIWDPSEAECESFVATYGCELTKGALCPDAVILSPPNFTDPLPDGVTLTNGCPAACGVYVPTEEECALCGPCAPCVACLDDQTRCEPGGDLFTQCSVTCRGASPAGDLAELCASETCTACAGDACAGCETDPTLCYPAIGGQPAGAKYESCVAAGCTTCQACEACLADPALCAPESPGGELGYCWSCGAGR